MTDVEDMSTEAESLDREEIGGSGGGRGRGWGGSVVEVGGAGEVGAWWR